MNRSCDRESLFPRKGSHRPQRSGKQNNLLTGKSSKDFVSSTSPVKAGLDQRPVLSPETLKLLDDLNQDIFPNPNIFQRHDKKDNPFIPLAGIQRPREAACKANPTLRKENKGARQSQSDPLVAPNVLRLTPQLQAEHGSSKLRIYSLTTEPILPKKQRSQSDSSLLPQDGHKNYAYVSEESDLDEGCFTQPCGVNSSKKRQMEKCDIRMEKCDISSLEMCSIF